MPPRCNVLHFGVKLLNVIIDKPLVPPISPITLRPLYIAVRVTARMARFIPGASPPEVSTLILYLVIVQLISHIHFSIEV